ncbi:MAG: hypothetical protein Q8P59_10850 [Dehalococcoidia bacterium]|nr:hypothetical protein [Dehalococcoidia bacterium]
MLRKRDFKQPVIRMQEFQNNTLQNLVGNGIDDLAKYRIVQYLRECAQPRDVSAISASLGLHPVELVTEALESLVSNGILVRGNETPPLYTLSYRPTLRTALQSLFGSGSAQEMGHIFRALAAASLAKAKARAHGGEVRR